MFWRHCMCNEKPRIATPRVFVNGKTHCNTKGHSSLAQNSPSPKSSLYSSAVSTQFTTEDNRTQIDFEKSEGEWPQRKALQSTIKLARPLCRLSGIINDAKNSWLYLPTWLDCLRRWGCWCQKTTTRQFSTSLRRTVQAADVRGLVSCLCSWG